MTALAGEADWDDRDPLDEYIVLAQREGWSLIPQVGHGTCDNALMRQHNGFVDVVTIPEVGHSTVVRLQGGPEPAHLRRTGHQWWRHLVPPELAVKWALTDCRNDDLLTAWDLENSLPRNQLAGTGPLMKETCSQTRNKASLDRESPCRRTRPRP